MFDKNLIVFLDGEYKKLSETTISPTTHSLHYGTAVFEGIRAYQTEKGTAIFRLSEHIERLFYSAKVMQMDITFSLKEVENICVEILRKNKLKSAYIRPLVFYDENSLGITTKENKTRLLILAWEWGKYLANSVTVKISPYRRISEKSTVADAKISGHYANSFLATMDAKKDGFDEALLLDHNEAIAEGPGENIFFIKEKKLYTPTNGKILPGITRDSVLRLAKEDLNYKVREKEIFPEDLDLFEGAFFTGTAAEITPIEKIQSNAGEFIFDVEKGKDIKELFFRVVAGREKSKLKWLTTV